MIFKLSLNSFNIKASTLLIFAPYPDNLCECLLKCACVICEIITVDLSSSRQSEHFTVEEEVIYHKLLPKIVILLHQWKNPFFLRLWPLR